MSELKLNKSEIKAGNFKGTNSQNTAKKKIVINNNSVKYNN